MHGWKKKLDSELDEIVRSMPSEFAPENLPAAQAQAPKKSGNRRPFRIAAAATACAVLLAVLLPVLLILGPFANTGGVILMEINPTVRLYTDENGAVTAVYSENTEGDILLSDQTFAASLRGIPAADAATKLAERAFAAGFVREGESAVRFTVAADKNASAEELQSALESSVTSYFCETGLFVPVLSRTAELSIFGEGNAREQAEKAQGTPATVTEREAAATDPNDVEESYRDSLLRYTREVTDCVYRTASGKKNGAGGDRRAQRADHRARRQRAFPPLLDFGGTAELPAGREPRSAHGADGTKARRIRGALRAGAGRRNIFGAELLLRGL